MYLKPKVENQVDITSESLFSNGSNDQTINLNDFPHKKKENSNHLQLQLDSESSSIITTEIKEVELD